MSPPGHDWRGQTSHDEWRTHAPLALFVCASCGAVYHPGGRVPWTAPCPGDGASHRERYALPKGKP